MRIAKPAVTVCLIVALTAFGLSAAAQMAESADQEAVTIEIEGERPEPPVHADVSRTAALIVERTNAFRQQQGLAPVAVDPALEKTAREFAAYMAEHDRYGHQADGRVPSERAKAGGYDFAIVAENVAYAYDSRGFDAEKLAERLTKGWIDSPEHRENMVDPDVVHAGVAVAESARTRNYYAVQLFGRPASLSIRFTLLNATDAPIAYDAAERDFVLEPRFARTHQFGRPTDLTIRWPETADQQATTIRPKTGERFRIEKNAEGEFQVVAAPVEQPAP